MDTNSRGGPPGFVRILSNDEENGLVIVYPEYSGNRLYQTLGNLQETPQAGLVFPNFDTGDVLYVTGKTEILAGKAASDLIAHTKLAIKIKVEVLRFVAEGLGFRGQLGELSPYNPPVRYLSTEDRLSLSSSSTTQAKLLSRDVLSPTVARFRFELSDMSSTWKPGQYVALSFEHELDIGYSHMRDDDPKSLNDDFLRSFTVSSKPDGTREFEITMRKVGVVTEFLFKRNIRNPLEVAVMGFGGEFYIQQTEGEKVAFVAGGVGITPLIAQAQDLDLERLSLYWSVRAEDLGLVKDTFERVPRLAASAKVFITGKVDEQTQVWKAIQEFGAVLHNGRLCKDDLAEDFSSRWYLCTGIPLRNSLLGWLDGKTVLYEDFNY
jgi:NAD(P)H-flavin reductase